MLDEITPARTILARVGQKLAYHVELVEARPDLHSFLASGFLVFRFNDLSVIFEDISQAIAGEDALPQIVCLEAVRIRRITRAVVPALVKGQEPRRLAFQLLP